MKRNYRVAAIFFLALVFFLPASYGSTALAQATRVLKVGSFNPRSGLGAAWGINADRANDLAANERNKKGGIVVQGQRYTLELIHEDDKGRGEEGVKAANKLIYTDKVKFIVGPLLSTPFSSSRADYRGYKNSHVCGLHGPAGPQRPKICFQGYRPLTTAPRRFSSSSAKSIPN